MTGCISGTKNSGNIKGKPNGRAKCGDVADSRWPPPRAPKDAQSHLLGQIPLGRQWALIIRTLPNPKAQGLVPAVYQLIAMACSGLSHLDKHGARQEAQRPHPRATVTPSDGPQAASPISQFSGERKLKGISGNDPFLPTPGHPNPSNNAPHHSPTLALLSPWAPPYCPL